MNWFATFFFLWAAGTCAAVSLIPARAIGAYFFRFNAGIALAMVTVACVVGRPLLGERPAVLMAWLVHGTAAALSISCLALAVGARMTENVRGAAFLAPAVAGLAFAATTAWAGGGVLLAAHLVTSAWVLGASLIAMTLGHWYLANAALSFDLLQRLTRFFVAGAIAKLVISGVYVVLDAPRLWQLTGEHFDGVFAMLRIGAGLIGGLTLALMAHSCAKLRSNQSATGILYVAVILVVIGEVTSLYLTLGSATRLAL